MASVEEVVRWLEALGLAKYVSVFRKHKVSGRVLARITPMELALFGLDTAQRDVVLGAIRAT